MSEKANRSRLEAWMALGLIGAAVVVFGLAALMGAFSGEGESEAQHSPDMAAFHCEDTVRDRLKSPSSAEFSDVLATSASVGWNVSGTVDAENSFGASIRHSFTCHVKPGATSSDYLVKVTSLTQ